MKELDLSLIKQIIRKPNKKTFFIGLKFDDEIRSFADNFRKQHNCSYQSFFNVLMKFAMTSKEFSKYLDDK